MRWLRIVGLLALVVSLLVVPQHHAQAAEERLWLAEPMLLQNGRSAARVDVAPIDATHTWAVSGKNILFFNGTQWTIQHTSSANFAQIEMLNANKGWALAQNDYVDPRTTKFYEFDGTRWNEKTAPDVILFRLYVASDGSVFAVGWNGIQGSNSRSLLRYFDGNAWQNITPFDRASYHVESASDGATWIWGNAFDGISMYDAPKPFVYRYSAGTLISTAFPSAGTSGPDIVNRNGLVSAVMISTNDGWASLIKTNNQRTFYRYQSGTWIETSIPAFNSLENAENMSISFIAGTQNDVLAQTFVGNYGEFQYCDQHRLMRFHAGTWTVISEPQARMAGALRDSGDSTVGWISSVNCPDQNIPAKRWRYTNGTFTQDTAGSDIVPSEYHLVSDDVQWAVGGGMIMHYSTSTMPTAPVAAKAGARYFPETGHNISGLFRNFYETHGLDFGEAGISAGESLALFGYPLTEEFQELNPDTGEYLTVQYFERVRMEYHPTNPDPYKVLLGRLGAVRYVQVYSYIQEGDPNAPVPAGCERFTATQHDLCPPFRDYWNSVGSVQIFGMPIANAANEVSYTDGATYLTLWTERERLEHHTELAGTRYEILLGLLAKEDLRMRGYLE